MGIGLQISHVGIKGASLCLCPTESKQTLKGWPCFRGALHSKYSKSHKKVQNIQKTLALAYESMFL